ncbi:POC1 centriolar protein A [Ceratobasidium sp. 428]|nr:POC1 centriolar protein A [Ceratobasidium sp. 428]
MASRRVLGATGDVAFQLLRLTAASADAFPPLKSAAGGALHIVELKFKSNKEKWRDLGTYVQDATASVVQSLARVGGPGGDAEANLEKLKTTLEDVTAKIVAEQSLPRRKRIGKFLQDPEMIADMRGRVDNCISLFQLTATTMAMIDVSKTLDAVIANGKTLLNISRKASLLIANTTLDKLPRAQGASWDPSRGCMEDTRVELIEGILEWANGRGQLGPAQILLLTAVAGAGKSTVAHTIARICHENKHLGSSFFFDRETDGRNTPNLLFATIAADLSRLDANLSNCITAAIEDDRGLPSAPLSRQFEELILEPCRKCPVTGTVVIVIDALDEAWDEGLLNLLGGSASRLPSNFRILLTSRMRPELAGLLCEAHVSGLELNIGAPSNQNDIALYVPAKLGQLAKRRGLPEDWPGEQLRREFVSKSDGLFLWVAAVCDYLSGRNNPMQDLSRLLATGSAKSAEDKMNKLYAEILGSFDWDDESFVEDYQRVMGTAIASKTPLTIVAMKELYHDIPLAFDFTLQRLSPLLTGMRQDDHGSQPVRVLHQSLRDFLVAQDVRASCDATEYRIVEREQSQRLALLCLELINRSLNATTPGTGYLTGDEDNTPGVPKLPEDSIPEALRYACLFWQSHIDDEASIWSTKEALEKFLDQKLTLWMELTAVCGQYGGLSVVQKWIHLLHNNRTIVRPSYEPSYAETSLNIRDHLKYEDRREETLEASSEALRTYRLLAAKGSETFTQEICRSLGYVALALAELGRREEALAANEESLQLYRELAKDQPAAFIPGLTNSLNNLSNHLADMGRREEALAAIEEAVQLHRQLAADRPAAFTTDLANSLTNLSGCLSDMGRREEALAAIEEAVQLYRQLAVDRPAAFTPDLALFLNGLSNCLSDMGRREEALAAIEEAVQLHRQLAADRPAAFTPDLAMSLHNLSIYLSDMGRREEALAATEEAVQLHRQLATDRPAAFTPDLSQSLNNLSVRLSNMGRREEALAAIEEAVQLRRQLAADRPAAFTPDLSQSLSNLSNRLSDMGRCEEALAAIEEAVQLYRQLAADRPAAFTSDLSMSLNNLSNRLSDLGRREEALAAVEEAVQLYRQLAADRPAAFASELADSLHNLSLRMSDFGRHAEALSAVREAIMLWRPLAANLPLRFNRDVKLSLRRMSNVLKAMGRHEEAAKVKAEMESLPD